MIDTDRRLEDGVVAVLDRVVAQRRAADAAEAALLVEVVDWVDLHPVVDGAQAFSTGGLFGGGGSHGQVAGSGTPTVTEDAVVQLAAALGVSFHSGLALVAETLELRYRLPRLWALVQDGSLVAWKARKAAAETTQLSSAAVAFVDRHLAVLAAKGQLPAGRVAAAVTQALALHDPDTLREQEQAALDARGVWLDHRDDVATTRLTATLDTLAALDLDAALDDVAQQLQRLGDVEDRDHRRATALGLLAHPQDALDLFQDDRLDSVVEHAGAGATLYLHLSTTDLVTDTGGGRAERLGPASARLVGDWLARLGLRPGAVRIRPVLDLDRDDAVDTHDPPAWMRELVVLRDRRCVFPGCTTDARSCDLDHVEPYVPPDDGGPPGQTRPANLAPLCRRHHRAKTHAGWRYERDLDGRYAWTSPPGRRFTVHPC